MMSAGDSLLDSLMSSIDKVDFVLVVRSPSSLKSHWVQEELKAAMSRQIQRHRITVLPLLKGRCLVPGFLGDRLYEDFTSPYRGGRICHTLLRVSCRTTESRTRAKAG